MRKHGESEAVNGGQAEREKKEKDKRCVKNRLCYGNSSASPVFPLLESFVLVLFYG